MEFEFRLVLPGEPAGQIGLARLLQFAREFQMATFRSAQAELNIPAYRRKLGDEPRPQYRLIRLDPGSTRLTVGSLDDREISRLAVTRHLAALARYEEQRTWPPRMYQGELQAWGAFYNDLLAGAEHSFVEVGVNGATSRVTKVLATALAEARPDPERKRITCVGTLHMIEIEKRPRFRVDTEEIDLVFELSEGAMPIVDPLRWRRVKVEALWEVGTNRAELIGNIEPTEEPAGVVIEEDIVFPQWVPEQEKRLNEFATLKGGWNGSSSQGINPAISRAAGELSRRIAARFTAQIPEGSNPYFFPNDAGNVEFEWQVANRFLLAEVVQSGYDLLASVDKDTLFEGPASQTLLFDWIRWLLTGRDRPS